MDSNSDTAGSSDRTMAIYARIAGLSFLFAILYAWFSVNYIANDIIVWDDNAATVENLAGH